MGWEWIDRFEAEEAKREKELLRRPVCDICGEHIQEDYCYEVGNQTICKHCIDDFWQEWKDEQFKVYIEED